MSDIAGQDGEGRGKAQNMRSRNMFIALSCSAIFVVMIGVSFAAVPLYRIFCQVTGYGGTTQAVEAAPLEIIDREITVRFDANVNSDLPWDFAPEARMVKVKLGEQVQLNYIAQNFGVTANTGMASFNVTPHEAGAYFSKISCFCFNEQLLEPGQEVSMPVVFFVDPAINDDKELDRLKDITLSYTFMAVPQS